MLTYYIYDLIIRTTDLEHFTRWAYYFNSFFTTICFICDVFQYLDSSEAPSKEIECSYYLMDSDNKQKNFDIKSLNDFNRNKLGVVFNTYSYFVTIGFWILYLVGNKTMLVSANVRSWFNAIYHHFIISIILIVDIFQSKRKKHDFSWKYFGIIFFIYFFYCVIITVEKYVFQRPAYKFMALASPIFLIFIFTLSFILLTICYFIHILLINLKLYLNKLEKEEDNPIINTSSLSESKEDNYKKFLEEGRY